MNLCLTAQMRMGNGICAVGAPDLPPAAMPALAPAGSMDRRPLPLPELGGVVMGRVAAGQRDIGVWVPRAALPLPGVVNWFVIGSACRGSWFLALAKRRRNWDC